MSGVPVKFTTDTTQLEKAYTRSQKELAKMRNELARTTAGMNKMGKQQTSMAKNMAAMPRRMSSQLLKVMALYRMVSSVVSSTTGHIDEMTAAWEETTQAQRKLFQLPGGEELAKRARTLSALTGMKGPESAGAVFGGTSGGTHLAPYVRKGLVSLDISEDSFTKLVSLMNENFPDQSLGRTALLNAAKITAISEVARADIPQLTVAAATPMQQAGVFPKLGPDAVIAITAALTRAGKSPEVAGTQAANMFKVVREAMMERRIRGPMLEKFQNVSSGFDFISLLAEGVRTRAFIDKQGLPVRTMEQFLGKDVRAGRAGFTFFTNEGRLKPAARTAIGMEEAAKKQDELIATQQDAFSRRSRAAMKNADISVQLETQASARMAENKQRPLVRRRELRKSIEKWMLLEKERISSGGIARGVYSQRTMRDIDTLLDFMGAGEDSDVSYMKNLMVGRGMQPVFRRMMEEQPGIVRVIVEEMRRAGYSDIVKGRAESPMFTRPAPWAVAPTANLAEIRQEAVRREEEQRVQQAREAEVIAAEKEEKYLEERRIEAEALKEAAENMNSAGTKIQSGPSTLGQPDRDE